MMLLSLRSVFNRQFRDAFKRVLRIRRQDYYGSVAGADGTAYRAGSEMDEPPSRGLQVGEVSSTRTIAKTANYTHTHTHTSV